MDIHKALKLEKKQTKWFYIIMTILFISLPLAIYLTNMYTSFFIISSLVLELLIVLVVISKLSTSYLTYSCRKNRLKIKSGLFSKELLFFCDKVVLVHTEKIEEDMEIYIITTVNIRNRGLKLLGKSFLKRVPDIKEDFKKVKKANEGSLFYYQVIRRGGLKKYLLLNDIYRNCVKAEYTDKCIQNIKIAKGQTLG